MAKITYIPTILKFAGKLCQVIARATPIIVRLYPSNTSLHDALAAANTACAVLVVEAEKVREYGD